MKSCKAEHSEQEVSIHGFEVSTHENNRLQSEIEVSTQGFEESTHKDNENLKLKCRHMGLRS